jgi:hypothetical protein
MQGILLIYIICVNRKRMEKPNQSMKEFESTRYRTERKRKMEPPLSASQLRKTGDDNFTGRKIRRPNQTGVSNESLETQKVRYSNTEWDTANNALIKMLELSLRQSRHLKKLLSEVLSSNSNVSPLTPESKD